MKNKTNNYILPVAIALLSAFNAKGQISQNADQKVYKLAEITVDGETSYNDKTVITYTGLKVGENISVPGPKINKVIKKLWKSDLFEDVNLYVDKIEGEKVFLRLEIIERPKISDVIITGLKKGKRKEFIKENKLNKGVRITQNLLTETNNYLKDYYADKGYYKPEIDISTVKDSTGKAVKLMVNTNSGERVKIREIKVDGNKELSDATVRSAMKKTKKKLFGRFWKKSKFIKENYQEDLKSIVSKYKSEGFRDAKVVTDTVYLASTNELDINLKVEEGKRYFIRDLKFTGNTAYKEDLLKRVLTYTTGDVYDLEGIAKKVNKGDNDNDIASLYYDNGYIFNNVSIVETAVAGDSIDVEIRVTEGDQATLNKVTFSGNDRTNDHVIARSLRTVPGDLFSRSNLKRTMRELSQLPYLDPQQIKPDVKPNQQTNTVDIDYALAEKGSSEIQLQGGWGGGRLIGTLGLTFNNFSLRNLLKGEAWRPVPLGDGQTLSLKAQAANGFSSYSLSFTEPWLGGSRPTSLSVSFYHTIYDNSFYDNNSQQIEDGKLKITGANIGLSKRLSWPDDYFFLSQNLSIQRYDLENYAIRTFDFSNGYSNNLSYAMTFGRNSTGPNPIFPTEGSEFSLSAKLTPPYSFFNNKDDNWDTLTGQEKFKWLEYYKIKFKSAWYRQLAGKVVMKMGAEFGMLSNYNDKLETPPFERFYLGGTGMTAGGFDGRENVPLRGYQDPSSTGGGLNDLTPADGGVIYNKLSMEVRYPITLSQSASIYGLAFFEAGSISNGAANFSPFELKRSAGAGVRIFMPAFGLLGIDFGYGFDNVNGTGGPSGWQTHFIIGQQF